jgi:large-conductance mechanosensitive channel
MPLVFVSSRPPAEFLGVIKTEDWNAFHDEMEAAQPRNDECDPLTWLLAVLFVVSILSFVLVPCALFFLVVYLLRRLHSIKEQEQKWNELRRIMHKHNEEFTKCGAMVAILVEADGQAVVIVTRGEK